MQHHFYILKAQIASVHEEKKSHKCNVCNRTSFTQKANLKVHIASVHERKKILFKDYKNIKLFKTHLYEIKDIGVVAIQQTNCVKTPLFEWVEKV